MEIGSSRTKPADWIPLLTDIADSADAIALSYYRSPELATERKADRTVVTRADREIEQAIRALVEERAAGLAVFGEECGAGEGTDGAAAQPGVRRLIVDPIDGTENFRRGIPIFATLLAVEEDGAVVAGLVSAPALGTRWQAARGAGAFCLARDLRAGGAGGTRSAGGPGGPGGLDGAGGHGGHGPTVPRRLHVSSISVLDEAQVFHSGLRLADIPSMPGFAALLARAYRTRGFGDFWQHILVAEGAGEIAIDPVMKPWDIGPLLVIVEEAGGRSTSLEGRASVDGGSLLTTNGLLHEEALAILRGGSSEGGEEDGMQGPAR